MALRVGLIGCGDIGTLRARALARTSSLRLAAVSDVDPARSSALARTFGATVEDDWHQLVHRTDIDVVVVSTPPSMHADMAIEALAAGKHVLCEKPLARTSAEGRAMIEMADQRHRVLATGFNYRFYPSIRKAWALLQSGVIGELDHIRAYTGYSAREHGHPWLHDATVMGGGALRDNGVHLIDLTCYFLGDVADAKGFTSNRVWRFPGCEDNGFALLRSSSGRIASLHASWTEWRGYRLRIELYGTRGCIRAWCFPMLTQLVAVGVGGSRTRKRLHVFPLTQLGERLRSYRWVVVESFVQELEAFAQSTRGARTAGATGRDGLRALEVAEAVSASQDDRVDAPASSGAQERALEPASSGRDRLT